MPCDPTPPTRTFRLCAALIACAAVGTGAGCGAKGAAHPPPPRLPERVRTLEVHQEGGDIVVSFRPPEKMQTGGALSPPVRFEILAVVGAKTPVFGSGTAPGAGPAAGGTAGGVPGPAAAASGAPNATNVASSADPLRDAHAALRFGKAVKVVPYDIPEKKTPGSTTEPPASPGAAAAAKPGTTPSTGHAAPEKKPEPREPDRIIVRLAPSDFTGVRLEASRLTVGVSVVDGRNRRAPPSQAQAIEPLPPLPQPSGLAAAMTPRGVRLSWSPPELSSWKATPAAAGAPQLLVAVYRWKSGDPEPQRPLRTLAAETTDWLDEKAPRDERLAYAMRISAGTGPPRRESLPAGPVEVETKDTFPPSPPRDLVAVSHEGAIRLFWFPPEEIDVTGYRVYRADGAAGEDAAFRLMEEVPALQSSTEDAAVTAGAIYSWRVTAVDAAEPKNESAPSAIVTATAGVPGEAEPVGAAEPPPQTPPGPAAPPPCGSNGPAGPGGTANRLSRIAFERKAQT